MQVAKISEHRETEEGEQFIQYAFVFTAENEDEQTFATHIARACGIEAHRTEEGFTLSFTEPA